MVVGLPQSKFHGLYSQKPTLSVVFNYKNIYIFYRMAMVVHVHDYEPFEL
jgi:hypothetical protein